MGKYAMLDALNDFITRIDSLKLPYMVTGSFAMGVYVPSRNTLDIDIVIEISPGHATAFEAKFAADYYVNADSIRRAIDNQSMFNVLGTVHGVKIDCIVRRSTALEKHKFERRQQCELGGVRFFVISLEDLILSKLSWASESLSERQFEDIFALLGARPDSDYLHHWVQGAGLNGVWTEFEKWTIRAKK